MRDAMLIIAAICAVAAIVSGVLGFLIFPRLVARQAGHERAVHRRSGHKQAGGSHVSKELRGQGLSRAMFIIFAAAAFVSGFFGMLSAQ